MNVALKTVKQVCEITSLTRKVLYEYKDIVKPSAYATYTVMGKKDGSPKDGYKLYNDEAVAKFKQVAVYRELGLSKKEIGAILTAPNYNVNQVWDEQLTLLHEKQKKIEQQIAAVELFRVIGTQNNNLLDYIKPHSLTEFAEHIERCTQAPAYDELIDMLQEKDILQWEEEMLTLLSALPASDVVDLDDEENFCTVQKIFETCLRHLGVWGFIMLVSLSLCFYGEGKFIKEFDALFADKLTSGTVDAITEYSCMVARVFLQRIDELLSEHSDISSLDDARSKQLTDDIKYAATRCFGIKTDRELSQLIEAMNLDQQLQGTAYQDALILLERHLQND